MAKSILSNPLVLVGGGVAAYLLLSKHSSPAVTLPGGGYSQSTNAAVLPQQTQSLTGINSGIKGSNGTYYTVANYSQLAQLVPSLLNPNYVMTPAENAQYVANYLDLQQALPTWIGYKQPNNTIPRTVADAAQVHWTYGGCAQQRIFLPLNPPSNANQIPPPPNPKSSGGGSFLSSALNVATTILPFILGSDGSAKDLNDADLQLLFTGGYVMQELLPMFETAEPGTVKAINNRFTELLTPYF